MRHRSEARDLRLRVGDQAVSGVIGHTISTAYWRKPIPDRRSDWTAVLDNYEPGHPIGEGETEAEAIADLKEQLTDETNLTTGEPR